MKIDQHVVTIEICTFYPHRHVPVVAVDWLAFPGDFQGVGG
jgi:hypothetical protein